MTGTETTTSESLRILAKKKRQSLTKTKENVKKKRKETRHLFKKGQSGNPSGRPVGSRNKLTVLKEAVLKSAENIVLDNFEAIVQATVELAKKGDPTCLKIIWDRVIPGKRSIEDKDRSEDKLNISISIEGMDVEEAQSTFEGDNIVEAEFKEIK